jgi:hypothetical protein
VSDLSSTKKRAFVTVITRNYAHYAEVLLKSCRESHSDADRFAVFADSPPASWLAKDREFRVVEGESLGIANWKRFAFQYTPFELSCALKPFAMSYLIEQGYDEVVYLDGDMRVYDRMSCVFDALSDQSIVLTPHLLKPLPNDNLHPHESAFLSAGTFNAGFLAVSGRSAGRDFLNWWKSMMLKHCIIDTSASLFVDQKFLNLVPGMFPEVHVLRHPGYNAGHWSMSRSDIALSMNSSSLKTSMTLDGEPLILFHFSGMAPSKPNAYLKYQKRFSLEQRPVLRQLVDQYFLELADADWKTCEAWGCAFDTLSDGTPIQPEWREAIRQSHPVFQSISDPFDILATKGLAEKFKSIELKVGQWRKDWKLKPPKPAKVARWPNIRKLRDILPFGRSTRKSA